MVNLSTLKSAPGARRPRKRVGRGMSSGHGKTATRGSNGAQSRSGYQSRPGFEGGQMPLHRRLPKRGFGHEERWPMAIVNVDTLESVFDDGTEVTSAMIVAAGLARRKRGGVKVLGRGEIKTKLTLKVQAVTPGAQAKIEAAGGTVEIISLVAKPAAENETKE